MKLTSKDFDIHKCNEKEWYYFISKQNPKLVIKQILSEHEKAAKYDQLCKDCQTDDLDMHISCLCDGSAMLDMENGTLRGENKQLKEKAEKWDLLQQSIHELTGDEKKITIGQIVGKLMNENKQLTEENDNLSKLYHLKIKTSDADILYLVKQCDELKEIVEKIEEYLDTNLETWSLHGHKLKELLARTKEGN